LLSAAVTGTLTMEDWKPSVQPFNFLSYVEESTDMDTLEFANELDHGK